MNLRDEGAEMPERSSHVPHELGDRYHDIVESFREISLLSLKGSATLEDVLREVGLRLVSLLGVSRFSIFMRRSDGRFQGLLGQSDRRGSVDASVKRIVAGGRRDPLTTQIIETMAPVRVHNAPEDQRYAQRTVRTFQVTDAMGVPLIVEGEVIGVIFVDAEGEQHQFSDLDTDIASAFAGLAALAVWQRWLFQRLEERTRTISEQRRVLDNSRVVHDKVMKAILDDQPTDEILRQLSVLLGKPIVLYGADLRLMGAAWPDGVARQLPRETDGLLQEAAAELDSGEAASVERRVSTTTRARRLLVRLAADQQCVGYLALVARDDRFSSHDVQAMEQAGLAMALKLFSERRRDEVHEQERQQFLADIVYRRRHSHVLTERADDFGIDPERTHVLLLLRRPSDVESADVDDMILDDVRSVIDHASEDTVTVVASTGMPGADLFLLEVRGDGDASPGRPYFDAAFRELVRHYEVKHMVVSTPVTALADLPTCFSEVQDTVALLDEVGAPAQWVFSRDLLSMRMVMQREGFAGALQQAELFLSPLRAYDDANKSSLVDTLQAYIDRGAQVRGTAEHLGVHENTIRYRLNRMREIGSFDPERIEDLASAALALKVSGFVGQGGSS